MKKSIFIPFVLFISHFISAQTTQAIQFDGVVTPQEWEGAQTYTINYEFEPGDNIASKNPTDVYVKYDKEYILVGFVAYTDMSTLRSSLRNRDEAWEDDTVFFGVDTYGDGRFLVLMGSNAEGSQVDMKLTNNGNDDPSYDVNYYTKASKHENAYHVEMMIPFSGIQFEEAEVMNWSITVHRSTFIEGNRSQNLNFPLDRNNSCFICQSPAKLVLENVKPKNRVNLLPNVFSGVTAERVDDQLKFGKLKPNFGLSGLIDVNTKTSFEFAINPDFSQVEADVSQITVNNTFAIQYPERRPYFNEGNDFINFMTDGVYTRSINKPLVSTKLINQGKKQRYYWLVAYDEKSPYLVGGENQSYFGEGEGSVANIFRYQRNFEGGSNLGFVSTNRFYDHGGSGNLFGIDGLYRLKDKYTVGFEVASSRVVEPEADWIDSSDVIKGHTVALDGEENTGYTALVYANRSTKNWITDLYYVHKSPWFSTPLGFATSNNYKTFNVSQRYQHFFKEESKINTLNVMARYRLKYNFDGLKKLSNINFQTFMRFDNNVGTEISYAKGLWEEFYGFETDQQHELSWFLMYNPNEKFNIRGFASVGKSLYYDSDNPQLGRSKFVGTFNNFQLSPKFNISPSLRYTSLQHLDSDEYFYKGYIFRANINYQFNSDLSFRFVLEKNNFDDVVFTQTLFKYNPNPFTIFYVGGTTGYSYVDQSSTYKIDNAQVYFKFQYMFDL